MPFPHRLVASQHTGTVSEAWLTGQAAPVWSPAGMLLCYPKGEKKNLLLPILCVLAQGGRSWGVLEFWKPLEAGQVWGVGRLNLARLGAATPDLLLADPQWYPARQSLRLDPSEYSCPPAYPLGSWGQETRAVTKY